MIVVLASHLDQEAVRLVEAWRGEQAVLLSARDLCLSGWEFDPVSAEPGMFVAGGIKRPNAALRGVITRRPAVAAEELPWIATEDRQYVAAEINAFLVAWLSALPCPVLSRPTATSLCGPAWSQAQWRVSAARAGLRWSDAPETDDPQELLICNGRHHGGAGDEQVHQGVILSGLARTELLGIRFCGDAIAAVTVFPRLTAPAAKGFVLSRLLDAAPS